MKKFLTLSIFATLFSVAVSCSSSSTPSSVAEEVTKCIQKGDYDKLGEYIYAEKDDANAEQTKAMVVGMLKDKGGKAIEKKGGIKSYTTISEEISEDGSTAEVEVEVTYGDDSTENNDYDLINVDGKWYLEIKK